MKIYKYEILENPDDSRQHYKSGEIQTEWKKWEVVSYLCASFDVEPESVILHEVFDEYRK